MGVVLLFMAPVQTLRLSNEEKRGATVALSTFCAVWFLSAC
ncbi:MAG: hypothetical protein ACE5JJ_09875 [Nitrospinota bacterium]